MKGNQPQLGRSNYEVCHGDLNHKNWLLSDEDKLYLVDWDSAKLADPALDLSMLMCQYVPRLKWNQWVDSIFRSSTKRRDAKAIVWYAMENMIETIEDHHRRGRSMK